MGDYEEHLLYVISDNYVKKNKEFDNDKVPVMTEHKEKLNTW